LGDLFSFSRWRRLRVELLEDRRLLTATTEIGLDGSGNLTITDVDGGDTPDALVLATDAADLIVTDTDGNLLGVTGLDPADYSGAGTAEVRVTFTATGWTAGILVDTLAGDDTIRVAGLDLGRSAELAIDAGPGSDPVIFDTAPTNTNGGNLSVTADEITVDARVFTDGGAASLSAGGDVAFNAILDTGGAGLDVQADSDGDGSGAFSLGPGPGGFREQALLRASDTQAGDFFGYSVAVWGDRAVVGAPWEDGGPGDPTDKSGAAYVFARDARGVWTEEAVLRASDAQAGDQFGDSAAIWGDTVIVGATREDGGPGNPLVNCGAAYVFAPDAGGVWTEQVTLYASDPDDGDLFGASVSVSEDTAIVGRISRTAAQATLWSTVARPMCSRRMLAVCGLSRPRSMRPTPSLRTASACPSPFQATRRSREYLRRMAAPATRPRTVARPTCFRHRAAA